MKPPQDMASLDSGQSGFLQQEEPGNQVCFLLRVCDSRVVVQFPVPGVSFKLEGACYTPVLNLRGVTCIQVLFSSLLQIGAKLSDQS